MSELWRQLSVGDYVRLVAMPAEFQQPGCFVHRDTLRVYRRLITRRRPLRIAQVAHGGPWIHCRFRRRDGKWEYHWLLMNHGALVRVKHRQHPPTR